MNPLNNADDQIQTAVWDTTINLKIEMANVDLIDANIPIPLYFTIPRIGYLSKLFGDLIANFKNNVPMTPEEIWLEYENIPIKWQYPLGVIVDSLGIDLSKGPIPIYVHVRNIPKDKVLTYEGLDTLRKYYFAAIKEANMIKFPKEQKILNLDLDDTKLLNEIINSNQRNLIVDFRKVMNKVHSNSIIEKYPVRLIFNKTDLIITKPVNVPNEKINTYTLKNYLIDIFGEELYNLLKEKTKIIIHGLEIEEQISFLFYYLNFSYMDNFLYIVFYEKS